MKTIEQTFRKHCLHFINLIGIDYKSRIVSVKSGAGGIVLLVCASADPGLGSEV